MVSAPRVRVADVAHDMGFRDSATMARAFAIAGFPPPNHVRELLLDGQAA
jgi:hypothetical protein